MFVTSTKVQMLTQKWLLDVFETLRQLVRIKNGGVTVKKKT